MSNHYANVHVIGLYCDYYLASYLKLCQDIKNNTLPQEISEALINGTFSHLARTQKFQSEGYQWNALQDLLLDFPGVNTIPIFIGHIETIHRIPEEESPIDLIVEDNGIYFIDTPASEEYDPITLLRRQNPTYDLVDIANYLKTALQSIGAVPPDISGFNLYRNIVYIQGVSYS